MKKFILTIAAAFACVAVFAQRTPRDVEYTLTEATELNLIGKFMDTPNPYHRVDTTMYHGFTQSERNQLVSSAGLAVLFKTNSTTISVYSEYGYQNRGSNTMGLSLRGYDLYIRKDGRWLYAATKEGKQGENVVLIKDMDNSEKECMLYLPIYSEMLSVKVGVQEGATLEPLESPFKGRIGIFGSSYTQGISTSRPGMSYPMQFMRMSGYQILSLGCSGNCTLQQRFADFLCDAPMDALIVDGFSNPSAKLIYERLFAFIEKVQTTHPDMPIIFLQTIRRGSRNFSLFDDRYEQAKQNTGMQMMEEACRKYRNVYFVETNADDRNFETSVDGTHPGDYGYTLWAESICKPVTRILRRHGIR